MKRLFCCVAMCAALSHEVRGSQDTIGPNGINSAGLTDANGQPLTGQGVNIGQVDEGRPGSLVIDALPTSRNSDVDPDFVLYRKTDTNFNPTPDSAPPMMNAEISEHAEAVAGVMISTATANPLLPTTPTGVSPGVTFYSVGINPNPPNYTQAMISSQHIISFSSNSIRAINMSFGYGYSGTWTSPNGNSPLTLFVDWSARRHDVLYVVAGRETGTGVIPFPSDNFNGITVGSSTKNGNVFREVSAINIFTEDAEGHRVSIDLIAPGDTLDVHGLNNMVITPKPSGTSLSAPHVTSTVALLQQYANERLGASTPGWDIDAKRHTVMKAVLLNSADKIEDNGAFVHPKLTQPVPSGGFLGMERTVLKQDGVSTWFDSVAFDDSYPEGLGYTDPLDIEMGAGHLNANRARTQFSAGEFNPDEAVPVIGWSHSHSNQEGEVDKYVFNEPLLAGGFISISMAWDRVVEFATDGGTILQYDVGDTFVESMEILTPRLESVHRPGSVLAAERFV